jgi:putative endonuclease
MDAYMYILKCADGTYYTGSTKKLVERIHQHKSGNGSNYTRDRLPVILVYLEYYPRIEDAFLREKQVQRWSAAKKEALIKRDIQRLKELAACKNLSHFLKKANPSKE